MPKISEHPQTRLLAGLGLGVLKDVQAFQWGKGSKLGLVWGGGARTKEGVISNLTPEEPQNKPIIFYHGLSIFSPIKFYTFCHAMGFPTCVETKPYPETFRNRLAKPGLVKWCKTCGFMGYTHTYIYIYIHTYIHTYIYTLCRILGANKWLQLHLVMASFPIILWGSFFQDCTGLQVISMHCGPTTSHGPHVWWFQAYLVG